MDILVVLFKDDELQDILNICPGISYLDDKDIYLKLAYLKKLNLNDKEIRDVIYTNPHFLESSSFIRLDEYFKGLDIKELVIKYPFIFDYDVLEIDNVIKKLNIRKDDIIYNPLILESFYS